MSRVSRWAERAWGNLIVYWAVIIGAFWLLAHFVLLPFAEWDLHETGGLIGIVGSVLVVASLWHEGGRRRHLLGWVLVVLVLANAFAAASRFWS